MRLLACACARSRWSELTGEDSRSAVEIAERRADGLAKRKDLTGPDFFRYGLREVSDADFAAEATNEAFPAHAAAQAISYISGDATLLVREIYGNPFRDVHHIAGSSQALGGRSWDIARRIYDDRRFEDLPFLADLLVEDGCGDRELVEHLRSPGPHFRGYWALDTVLGRDAGRDLVTEEEWLAETQPFFMLTWCEYLRGEANSRKRRLLACACCRAIWSLFEYERLRHAVEVAEAFADGRASEADLAQASKVSAAFEMAANEDFQRTRTSSSRFSAVVNSCKVACAAASATGPDHRLPGNARYYAGWHGGVPVFENRGQPDLIREILGNPSRKVAIDSIWFHRNDGAVREIAQAIYDERAFERMPILADALEDAGCSDEEILSHCRQTGPHVRGCWLLDLVLGRE
jgi:hypothetical protein